MLATNFSPSSLSNRRERRVMRGIIIVIVILLLPLIAFPQGKRANNWYFGWYAGITFNQGTPPIALTDSKMLASFLIGTATISNPEGEMQFYTDGEYVWNKIHEPMLNAGHIGTKCYQGAMIVPQPNHPNIYYLFNAERISSNYYPFQLQYSVISMNLDNGNGAIVPGYRCIPLSDSIVSMFTAVLHQNQKDIWVMSHKQGSNKYFAYLVTSGGLIDTPVESTAGPIFNEPDQGLMKFSPDGTKIAITNENSFQILDFDNLTGVVSDNNIINGQTGHFVFSLEFSPDNSVFYACDQNDGIFQYDLKAGNEAQILATEFSVDVQINTAASLQLGPDGKIYISPNSKSYLSVINKPNIVGAGCEFELQAVDLLGKTNNGRLPTFIQSYLADPKYTTSAQCFGQPTQFKIVNSNGIDSVLWEFNDPGNAPNDTSIEFNPAYTFSGPGTFYPKLTVWAGDFIKFVIDTVVIYEIPNPDLGSDTLIYPGELINITLNGGSIGQFYWNGNLSPGDSTYLVTDTGEYIIKVDNHGCIGRDTIQVSWFDPSTLLQALADTARKCLYQPANSDIKLARANGLRDMKAVLYFNSLILNCTNFNANEADFPGITAMIYSSPSRVELSWNGINALSSADTLLMGSLIFESYDNGISNIEWEDNRAVTWFLDSAGDSIEAVLVPGEIEIHELPTAAINAPLSVCEGGSAILTALVSGGTDPFELQWTTPSGSSFTNEIHLDTAKLTDSGKYTLTVSDRFHCTGNSEVTLNVIPLPTAGFPGIGDTIPFEQTYLLEATQGYSSYEWSTGDTTYYINVTEEGNYTVTMLTNEGCQAAEQVYMLETWLPISIPNAFTPNNDGLNDVFRPVIDYELVKRFNLTIYNRWGQRIFETVDASAGWDGKNAMTGVYVWMITYENRVGKMFEMKGNVTLVK